MKELDFSDMQMSNHRRHEVFTRFQKIRDIFEIIQQNHLKVYTLRYFVKLNIITPK